MLLNRSFQSSQRPWLPLYVGLVNPALNAVLDWVLLGPLGAAGLALSTSLVSMFNTAALAYLLRQQVGRGEALRIAAAIGRMLACAAAAAMVLAGLWHTLKDFAGGGFWQALAALLLTLAASAVAYAGAARLLRLEELGLVWRVLRRRRRGATSGGGDS